MKNLKALSIVLLLSVGVLSVPVCAADVASAPVTQASTPSTTPPAAQPATSPEQSVKNEQALAALEARVKAMEGWQRWYKGNVGVTALFVVLLILAIAGKDSQP